MDFHQILVQEERRAPKEERRVSKEECNDTHDAALSTKTKSYGSNDDASQSFSDEGKDLPAELLQQLETEGGDPYEKVQALFDYITHEMRRVRDETPVIVDKKSVEDHFFRLSDEDLLDSLNGSTKRKNTTFPHLPPKVQEVIRTQRPTPEFLEEFQDQWFILTETRLIPGHWYSLQAHVDKDKMCVGWQWSYRPEGYLWPCWVHNALCREDVASPHRKLNDLVDKLKIWVEETLSMPRVCSKSFDLFHTAMVCRHMRDGVIGLRCEWV